MARSFPTIEASSAPITVEYLPSALPLLTPKVQKVLQGVLPIVERLSAQAGIGPSRVVISGHVSPEDEGESVIVTQYVDLDDDAAGEHWNRIAAGVYRWAETLPPSLRTIAREVVSVAVWWDGQ